MELGTKKDRGTSLSQKQYDIIMSYLNTGVKPPLDTLKSEHLYGKLNGGHVSKSCGGYFRFKSIVTRLKLRQSDGALVFKGNGKVVLPNSKFSAAIKEAHTSPGHKHLNMTATIAKLSEKYTIGCRQFGISEEKVRIVVKSCREGSCAEKPENRPGVSIMKNIVKFPVSKCGVNINCKKRSTATVNINKQTKTTDTPVKSTTATSTPLRSVSPTTVNDEKTPLQPPTIPNQFKKQEPAYAILEKLPSGNFIIKQFVMKTPPQMQSGTKSESTSNVNTKSGSSSDVSTPTKPSMTASSSDISPGPLPSLQPRPSLSNNLIVMPYPALNQSMAPIYNMPYPSLNQSMAQVYSMNPLRPLSLQSAVKSTQFAIPVNFIISNPQPPSVNDIIGPARTLFPRNAFPSTSLYSSGLSMSLFDIQQKPKNDDDDVPMDDNNNIDVTINNMCKSMDTSDDEQAMEDEHCDTPNTSSDKPMPSNVNMDGNMDKVKVPFPFLWNNLADMEVERDPYTRINLAIKDMRSDVKKSLRGNKQAMETLKSKIDVVKQMVKVQKDLTEIYKDELINY